MYSLMSLIIKLFVVFAENNSRWMHWNPEQGNDNADNRPTLLLVKICTPKDKTAWGKTCKDPWYAGLKGVY